MLQDLAKLKGPMARSTLANHRPGSDVQGSEQTGGAMALVVVGSTFDLSGQHGEDGLTSAQGLDLALLIHAQHERQKGHWGGSERGGHFDATSPEVMRDGGVMGREVENIVLVHVAFADGSCWSKVILLLQEMGYHAVAVQNPTTSLADEVAFTKRIICAPRRPCALGRPFVGRGRSH